MKILAPAIVALAAFTVFISGHRETSDTDSRIETSAPTPVAKPGLEGYCWPLSAAPRERIDFYVSGTGRPEVGIVRAYASSVSRPIVGTRFTPTVQPTNPEPWRNGAGWMISFSFTIPDSWSSGIFAAELTDLRNVKSYITFIVRPEKGRDVPTIVIANVNTWLAYNNWGGRSKEDGAAHLSFMRPNPYASPVAELSDGGHLTRGELWLLYWLNLDPGHKPSVYTDIDFANGLVEGGSDKTLFLNTHPEYWTIGMYNRLKAFLASGGSVLYLGGNGIYEEAEYEFTSTNNGMSFRGGVEDGPREVALFRRLGPPRPERAILGVATERCKVAGGPYEVLKETHPLFRGTALRNGDTFGERGRNTGSGNGKAAGWYVDTSDGSGATGIPRECDSDPRAWAVPPGPGLPSGAVVLARGRNWLEDGRWKGAEMVYYRHPCGGSVFSVGSTTFTGSLVMDPKIDQIMRNVLSRDIATELEDYRLGEDPYPWELVSTRLTGERLYRIQLNRLSFDDSCPTNWYHVVRIPPYYHDALGRDACNVEISVTFPPGLRITPVEYTGRSHVELEPFTTSPGRIRRIFFGFSELAFRVERLSGTSIGRFNLTFEFLTPSETICRVPSRRP